jgi:ATP-dependent DNA ligase
MSRSGIQLCYPFDEKRLSRWAPPFIVQPKLDGDRCRAVIVENSVVLLSSECNVITSVPHINEFLSRCGFGTIELDGELYTHGMNHQLIHGIASRSVNAHSQSDDLELHLFDIVDVAMPQIDRIKLLSAARYILRAEELRAKVFGPVKIVPFAVAETLEDVLRVYDKFVEAGYEGIIVRELSAPYIRRRSTSVMKFKPKREDLYTIVGFTEEVSIHGEPKGRLGALVCRAQFGEEKFQVGSGFTSAQREDLWKIKETLAGNTLRVAYQHLTPGKGVPRFPVFIEILWTRGEEYVRSFLE